MDRAVMLRRALDAAVRPGHLVAPGLGTVLAGGLLAVGLPPLAIAVGGLGALTWGALVAMELAGGPRAAMAAAPPPSPALAEPFDALLAAVQASAGAVVARIDGHDGAVQGTLLEVRADCRALVEAAERLARRGDAVQAWLRSHDPEVVRKEIEAMAERRKRTRDPAAAASFLAAIEARRGELAARDGIRAIGERIVAELMATDAALDELLARVVALTLADPADAAARSDAVARDVRRLREQVGLLEKAAAQTLEELR